jgi:hypothetical protein
MNVLSIGLREALPYCASWNHALVLTLPDLLYSG